MIYYINGEFVDSTSAKISINDLGFLYGDGLFETMRFDNKVLFSPYKHMERLLNGLEIINLKIKQNKEQLISLLTKVIDENTLNHGIIRLMITRGESDSSSPSIFITIKPFYNIPSDPVKIIFLNESDYPIIRFTPAIKSMNYIGNMLAKKEASRLGAFEPLFYNDKKIITECAIRNIFFIKDNTILSPSLDLGILSGVMRDTVFDIAKDKGISIEETHIKAEELQDMDEAFITSTGIGLLLCYWDNWNSSFQMSKMIKKELFKRIKIN
tara:strand:- start:313 stop:1119 length:807 start_codon:yes stop_codon:yes gene_type:complete